MVKNLSNTCKVWKQNWEKIARGDNDYGQYWLTENCWWILHNYVIKLSGISSKRTQEQLRGNRSSWKFRKALMPCNAVSISSSQRLWERRLAAMNYLWSHKNELRNTPNIIEHGCHEHLIISKTMWDGSSNIDFSVKSSKNLRNDDQLWWTLKKKSTFVLNISSSDWLWGRGLAELLNDVWSLQKKISEQSRQSKDHLGR